MSTELELEVFRAGDYGPRGRWSADDIDRLVADYDATLHEAPVTLDHAQNGPSLGWVGGLRREGDLLLARLRGVNDRLMRSIREGTFRKRSIEIYNPLPETGRPYLKAVSFLGAAAPAVKGLRDPLFAESSQPGAAYEGDAATAVLAYRDTDPAVAFGQLKEELMRDGLWQPAWEDRGIERFCAELADHGDAGNDDGEPAFDATAWFAEFLRGLHPVVALGESAPARRDLSAARRHALALSAPAGNISPGSLELHRKTAEVIAGDPTLGYAEALVIASR